MSWLRRMMDAAGRPFAAGAPLERLHPLYEAIDTFLYSPGHVTDGPTHVRDGLDLKRMMFLVVIALFPCLGMAMFNTGYQANLAIAAGASPIPGWRTWLYRALGFEYAASDVIACLVHGALYFVPIFVVGFAVGIGVELVFAAVRRHEVNEGFFVTGFLYPLILPATTPLWQVALAIAFAVLVAKEIFGGTGMNILNIALVARAFLFFAYPAQISGNVWIAADGVDVVSAATPLAALAEGRVLDDTTWWSAFWGTIPGSMGETSALFCLLGALLLALTRVGSWRIMLATTVGTVATAWLFNLIGSSTNPMMAVAPHWHLVLGGWAFGMAFMATDPVTASVTQIGQLIYGLSIGVLVVLVRVVNPAYPEGMMLAILFMNLFAPLIDHVVVRANVRRRVARARAGVSDASA